MRVSGKYGVALVALLAVGAAPRIAAYRGVRGDDPCKAPGAMKATSMIPGTLALGERLESLGPATFQWSEGEIENPALAKTPMQFQIIRSFDGPFLYENPVRFAGARLEPEELRVREVEVDAERIPVHIAWDRTKQPSRLVAYFFAFDGRPVRSPLAAQLRRAVGLALGGPRPTTLVLVSGVASPDDASVVEDAAAAWLGDAWRYFAHACRER